MKSEMNFTDNFIGVGAREFSKKLNKAFYLLITWCFTMSTTVEHDNTRGVNNVTLDNEFFHIEFVYF
jgi:hypothetical protein